MLRDINILRDGSREYDPTPGRPKHRWKKNKAGFVNWRGHRVGKCPQDLKLSEAKELLQNAIPDHPSPYDTTTFPKNLYNVYRGVIYRAVGGEYTNYYHGFPCDKVADLDSEILNELKSRAEQSGYLNIFKKWVKEHA